MFIHWGLREIHLKIVYYGPALSGKTANMEYIYSKMDPALKGDLIMLKSREDRTIFFDFLQLEVGNMNGMKPKFNLYTVPGQVHYDLTRKSVLNSIDGLVFVADSQKEMMDSNLDTLLDLEKNLIQEGKSLETLPWVLQFNKRDLTAIESAHEMEAKLNLFKVPSFEASTATGQGIFPTLKEVIKRVVSHTQIEMKKQQKMRA